MHNTIERYHAFKKFLKNEQSLNSARNCMLRDRPVYADTASKKDVSPFFRTWIPDDTTSAIKVSTGSAIVCGVFVLGAGCIDSSALNNAIGGVARGTGKVIGTVGFEFISGLLDLLKKPVQECGEVVSGALSGVLKEMKDVFKPRRRLWG